MPSATIVDALAGAILAGEQTRRAIAARCGEALGRRWRWLGPLATRYLSAHASGTRPRRRAVVRFLRADETLCDELARRGDAVKVRRWLPGPHVMLPVGEAAAWEVPAITSAGELAEWLGITAGELDWFADLKGLGARRGAREELRHYRYHTLEKRSGGVRLLESPKPRLKALQRRILAGILDRIEPHDAAHGFRRGRSILTFVAPHTGQRVVLRMDLSEFFPSICGPRVQAFFRTAGYPERVADLLGGLCTNAATGNAWGPEYARPHLPQGAPTSPAVANLCAYRLDLRLSGLARAAGAVYTRYADDLAFSGGPEFEGCVERFAAHVAAVAVEEGFVVNHRKTRVMRRGVRQQLAGLVANAHANVRRVEFDRLKAILHNCVRNGAESQNRAGHADFRAHLEGRVSFVEMINPEKAARLRALFERIAWR